jgi:hypothetical protein
MNSQMEKKVIEDGWRYLCALRHDQPDTRMECRIAFALK